MGPIGTRERIVTDQCQEYQFSQSKTSNSNLYMRNCAVPIHQLNIYAHSKQNQLMEISYP